MRATYPIRTFATLSLALFLAAPLGLVQGQAPATTLPSEQPENAVKVLRVREGDAEQVATLLRSFGVDVRTSDRLGLITVAGSPDNVDKAEKALQEIEQLTNRTPASIARDVELTIHFLGIVDQDSAPPAGPLRDVVAELKKTFPFPGYKLLETVALRTRAGQQSQIAGLLPETLGEQQRPKSYVFRSQVSAIEPRQGSQLVRFEFIQTSIRLPPAPGINQGDQEIGINTALEVLDGQTVVVGKAGAVGESKGYLLVLTAKVVK
jgi:hypothetical protein